MKAQLVILILTISIMALFFFGTDIALTSSNILVTIINYVTMFFGIFLFINSFYFAFVKRIPMKSTVDKIIDGDI
jgi:hypothetical protein